MNLSLSSQRTAIFLTLTLTLGLVTSLQHQPQALAQESRSEGCKKVLQVEDLLRQVRGPRGQPLAARSFQTADGQVWVVGMEPAVMHATSDLAEIDAIIRAVAGADTDSVTVAKAATGSITRLAQVDSAGDYDLEALMVLKVDSPRVLRLNDPSGPEVAAWVSYFKQHVEKTLNDHPDYRFIELKAGEFIDPVSLEVKGIKWFLEDIRRGYQDLAESAGRRRVSLLEAFAQDARIKADWAVPAHKPGLLPGAYREASVLYRLGVQSRNNQVRIRPSLPSNPAPEAAPLRATAATLTVDDFLLLNEASTVAQSPSLQGIHQSILKSIDLYSGSGDTLKVIKRVFGLLQFYESPAEWVRLTPKIREVPGVESLLEKEFLELLNHPRLIEISEVKNQAVLLEILEKHRVTLPAVGDLDWRKAVQRKYDLNDHTLKAILSYSKHEVHDLVERELALRPLVKSYLQFVQERIPYVYGKLSDEATFLAVVPTPNYTAELARALSLWKKKYPSLNFITAQDAHLTVSYLGSMTEAGLKAASEATRDLGRNFAFFRGGAHILGRNNSILAIRFETEQATLESLAETRASMIRFGGQPEKRFLVPTPHISIATFDPSSPSSVNEVNRFLIEEDLSLLEAFLGDGMQLWKRVKPTRKGERAYGRISP